LVLFPETAVRLTIATPTFDLPVNPIKDDTQICQALASQFVKINIALKMNLMPLANFFGYIRVPSPKNSLFMSGFDIPSGDGGDLHAVQDYVVMTPRFDNFIYVFDMDLK
jgi:hypothetical protein